MSKKISPIGLIPCGQLSLISVALLSSLHAQDAKTIELKPLQITSTAIATDELLSTDAVEVYTAEDIEKSHSRNLYEFLGKHSSVFTTSGYGNPFTQKIDMRGYGVGDGYQSIVVTINGRRMNNVDMNPQLLSSISPSSIEKIEIIKSSGIVTAGDGANAGVINITTKKTNEQEIAFYLGTYGTADGSFYAGSSDDTLSISVNGEMQKNDGIRSIDTDGNKDENKFSTFNLNLAYTPIQELELRLDASTTHTDVIYAGSLSEAEYESDPTQMGALNYGATHQTYDSNALTLGTSYFINDNLTLNLDVSKEKKESNYLTYSSVYNYDYTSFKVSLDYDNDTMSITGGVDGFSGDVGKQSATLDLTKTNKAAYLMTHFYLNALTLKAGYRYEKVDFKEKGGESESDSLDGAELGANYLLSKESSVFANYSHSYQTASLDRLFSFFSGTYNGYVKPSEANNYEIGYNNITPTNKFKISLFYIDLKNEIYYYADPTYVNSKNTNIDKSHKYGLDLYDKYLINQKFSIALNYSYVEAIIDEESTNGEDYAGKDLPGVSNHNLKATVEYLANKHTTLSLTQIYRSDAYAANDFNNDFSQKQDAYMSTDISATYSKDNYEVFAKINNLFNQSNGLWIRDNAIYPVNFTTTAIAGLKLKF